MKVRNLRLRLASGAPLVGDSATRILAIGVIAALGAYMPPFGIAVGVVVVILALVALIGMIRTPRPLLASELAAGPAIPGVDLERWRARLPKLRAAVRAPRLDRPDLGMGLPSARSIAARVTAVRFGFRRADLLVIAVALAGLAWRIHGAFVAGDIADVSAYADHVARVKVGLPIYREAGAYPYLPGWLAVEVAVGHVSELIKVPFWTVIRMLIVASDFALIFAIWWLGTVLGGRQKGRLAAGIYAASPIAILVSGYHGMFDSLPLLLTVIAAGFAVRGSRAVLIAALLLGVAITLKPLAVIAIPVFVFATRWTLSQRLAALATSGLVVLAVSSPVLLVDPAALFRNVLGYGGVNDQGISGFLRALWMEREKTVYLPGEYGKTFSTDSRSLSVTLMAVTALLTWRYGLMRMCGAVYLAFLLTFGAVSTQYLLWPVPFLLLATLPLAVPVAYCLGAAAGAIGFYLVFWQQILFGHDATPINLGMAPQFLAGQAIALLVIAIAYAVSIAPAATGSRWRRPPFIAAAVVTILTAITPVNEVLWLLQEWWKIAPR